MFDDYTIEVPERLDQLAFRLYEATFGPVEAILDANPGLAASGLMLTVGDVIRVPRETTVGAEAEVIRLWD